MAKRKRIFTPSAKRWDKNPHWELAKIRARDMGITVSEASDLLKLELELAKIPAV